MAGRRDGGFFFQGIHCRGVSGCITSSRADLLVMLATLSFVSFAMMQCCSAVYGWLVAVHWNVLDNFFSLLLSRVTLQCYLVACFLAGL